MRVAVSRQHPLHLRVTPSSDGKFLVRNHQDVQQPKKSEETTVSPVVFPSCEPVKTAHQGPTILGDRFLLLGPAEGSTLYRCVDVKTGQHLVAKALTTGDRGGEALLQAHLRLEGTGATSGVAGVVDAPGGRRYLLLEGHHGDLHAYVRARRRLREPEARRLFRQAARAVAKCHENGVVLRDLKLRKFVFADEARFHKIITSRGNILEVIEPSEGFRKASDCLLIFKSGTFVRCYMKDDIDLSTESGIIKLKTRLRLESLEDAVIVEDSDDKLTDRRGCPAYVAPEVLCSGRAYSGKAADIWSLGVLLFTMLVGRYPFNGAEHASLFAKISRAQFSVPECLSSRARCLIRALLRRDPTERPASEDLIRHPWLVRPIKSCGRSSHDQLVPEPTNVSQD